LSVVFLFSTILEEQKMDYTVQQQQTTYIAEKLCKADILNALSDEFRWQTKLRYSREERLFEIVDYWKRQQLRRTKW
jgi:hypothetical protein